MTWPYDEEDEYDDCAPGAIGSSDFGKKEEDSGPRGKKKNSCGEWVDWEPGEENDGKYLNEYGYWEEY